MILVVAWRERLITNLPLAARPSRVLPAGARAAHQSAAADHFTEMNNVEREGAAVQSASQISALTPDLMARAARQ